ncbi:hypothetical protein GGI24_001995 [Coemansia furcata]|nr:hypothetical protein GGI24_001995 [Coemansia furcata]
MPPVSRDMARIGEIHAPRGESAMAHGEMDGNMGSPPETVKVARNWSRDETLSLVRAIKRHYEALKRCKTNQERSNVWHRIHKEHSSQFPGRSKKASQDRWGKVLSDYKDVMVHNKEKGAARWTFDFFKEVAGIVEGDTQYMDSAISPSSSSATSGGRPLPAADDLSLYSFGGASAAPPRSFAPGTAPVASGPPNSSVPRPPMAQHRMSEPNLLHTVKHDLRHMPHRPPPPLTAHVHQSNAMHTVQQQQQRPPMQNQLSPVDVHSGFDNRPPPARYSPPRRTSYPQLLHQQQQLLSAQANAASRASRGSYHTFRYYPQLSAGTPNAMPASPIGESEGVNRHGDIPKQMRVHSWAPSTGSAMPANTAPETAATINESPIIYPQSSHLEQGSQPVSPELQLAAPGDPEETCRHVLDMLGRQMRRIDVEQENLAQLKESTQNTIHRVEQIMQMYIRQPPPPPGSD